LNLKTLQIKNESWKQQSKWPKSAETQGGKDSIFTAENMKMSSATQSGSAIHGWL